MKSKKDERQQINLVTDPVFLKNLEELKKLYPEIGSEAGRIRMAIGELVKIKKGAVK